MKDYSIQHPLLRWAAVVSFLLLLLLMVTWPLSSNMQHSWAPFGTNLRLAAPPGTFALFNQEQPYEGSIVGLADERPVAFHGFDYPGIYYRQLTFHPGTFSGIGNVWWTFRFSRAYPLALTAFLPLIWLFLTIRRRGGTIGREGFE